MELFQINELSFAFPLQEQAALSSIRLTARGGEFITLCGQSGSGKSTLLRHLKSALTPHGTRSGQVLFLGRPLEEADPRTQAAEIGFVFQSPDNQIVTDYVWHELAFGLESLGLASSTIRLRVAEMASFFGIQTWFHKRVTELSGGQKQLLNLASVMAMHPSVLILDEPTSQLDPIAAADLLETVGRINRELGTTVIMTEHRLEEALPFTDRLVIMDRGAIVADGAPYEVGQWLRDTGHPMFAAMPAPMQIYAGVPSGLRCPVTVKEGREWLNAYLDGAGAARSGGGHFPAAEPSAGRSGGFAPQGQAKVSVDHAAEISSRGSSAAAAATTQTEAAPSGAGVPADANAPKPVPSGPSASASASANMPEAELRGLTFSASANAPETAPFGPVVIRFQEVWFAYERNGQDVLKDLSFEVREGQFYGIVGGNGTGKSTALSLVSGLRRPVRGKVLVNGRNPAKMKASELFVRQLGVLPQNPASLFVKKTVELDLYEMLTGLSLSADEKKRKVDDVIRLAELEHLLARHPYDLSGGEQQRAALAKVLLLEPRILLLDEPTKGLDAFYKEKLGLFLRKLHAQGVTIVMVSHDIEFCAKYAETCALFFDGTILTSESAGRFFAGNRFYTTAANRMARHIWPEMVTVEGVIERCRNSLQPAVR